MRVVSFNIKHGAGEDTYRGNPELTAEACKELNADVLAIQEIEQRVPRSKFANMGRLIAQATKMELIFEKTMRFGSGKCGNALLVRGEIIDEEVLRLRGENKFGIMPDKRNAIIASALIENQNYVIANTHLSTNKSMATLQLEKIMNKLSDFPEPQILLGDMNMGRGQVLLHTLPNNFNLIESPATFPSSKPRNSIDHIALKGLTLQSVTTIQLPISDHNALVAEVIKLNN